MSRARPDHDQADQADPRTSVVVATMDRKDELLTTLAHLTALPERPPIIVVDNASSDGSPAAVRAAHPDVDVIALSANLGAPARNVGVARADTPYVAFADDDSWWAPGSLAHAADVLDAHPRLGLVAARMLVGPEERLDSVSAAMATSPVPVPGGSPGPPIVGFLACGAIVRRGAFLDAGGFDDVVFFMGEEARLAYDLLAGGWVTCYLDEVVAHHHPSPVRDAQGRRVRQARNALLFEVMRRPAPVALARGGGMAVSALRDPVARAALLDAVPRLPRALAQRRRPSPAVERVLADVARAAPG